MHLRALWSLFNPVDLIIFTKGVTSQTTQINFSELEIKLVYLENRRNLADCQSYNVINSTITVTVYHLTTIYLMRTDQHVIRE